MYYKNIISYTATFLFIIVTGTATAQVKKSAKSAKFKVPHVTYGRAKKICPFSRQNKYPYQSIGVKLGDPFAITYKIYPNKNWALVGDAGISASGLSSQYYKNLFQRYVPEELNENVSYLSHEVPTDWCFQVKFLHQWKIHAIFKGLHVYTGLGWQWRITNLKYSYAYNDSNFRSNISKILVFETPRFTLGGLVVVGFEYAYFSLPISAFIETEFFVDTLYDPGYRNFQGSIGVRYLF